MIKMGKNEAESHVKAYLNSSEAEIEGRERILECLEPNENFLLSENRLSVFD